MRNALVSIAAAFLLAGCAGTQPGASRPFASSGEIEELHLFGAPIALDLDGIPGPDGVGVRVYASSAAAAKGRAIQDGILEVLMFDKPPAPGAQPPPRHIWSFTPVQ